MTAHNTTKMSMKESDHPQMQKITIDDMKELARKRGGECISDSYLGTDTKLTWRCAKGHIWENRPAKIKKGQWCAICAGVAPKGLDYLTSLASERGGECLSAKSPGMLGAARWRCSKGHEWLARPANIRLGTWCPFCAGKRQGIDEMQRLAQLRGGECLSDEYHGQAKKLIWKCRDGHTWNATPNSIKNGSWCPHCHINFGEEICRVYFETIFGKPFPNVRPPFLQTGPRGFMELDGYCEELKLAFEHHGGQHYTHTSHFHRVESDFQRQTSRDVRKLTMCQAAGVRVIEIPEVPGLTQLEKLPKIIAEGLRAANISPPRDPESISIDLNIVFNRSILEELKEIAQAKGGSLLSDGYLGDRINLRWRCNVGHEWETKPNGIKGGAWCPFCYGNVRKNTDEIRVVAENKGITLLSSEYLGTNRKLLWRCQEGHEWLATPHKILNETGCPKCAGKNKTIDDMREIASQYDGNCLSDSYLGINVPLEWECKQGHRFQMTPNYAQKNSEHWCPQCRRLALQQQRSETAVNDLINIASKLGGKILQGNYKNSKTRITIQCAQGHIWSAIADSLKRGSWCPHCSQHAQAERSQKSRLGIEAMRKLAQVRNGECISSEYVNNSAKLIWRCANRHEWTATAGNIKAGKWCPYCAGKIKKTVADMHELANIREFRFKSEEYIGDDKHHLWECKAGHQWNAKPSNIKQGRGCPTCAKKRKRSNQ